ncbi:MAG: glyoxalase [Acidimicrobiia bacterium]|nr:glyoxalase [Acidimicrobiia bacterium]MDH5504940.1 glyoxalase [Acidimicrobiia bacterium]
MQIDHVQLSGPPGCEDAMRTFWESIGFFEIPKPEPLISRGGCWLRSDRAEIHIGIEDPFAPARRAHPGFVVPNLDQIADMLVGQDCELLWDEAWPGRRRFYTTDPYGNRLEFLSERP